MINLGLTITGLDTYVDDNAFRALIRDFPDVEWGILWSEKMGGKELLYHQHPVVDFVISCPRRSCYAVHACGAEAREILETGIRGLEPGERIQVNGELTVIEVARLCDLYPRQRIITQHLDGQENLVAVDRENHDILVDSSFGRGITPSGWLRPQTVNPVGFCGGLGPETGADVFIGQAAPSGSDSPAIAGRSPGLFAELGR